MNTYNKENIKNIHIIFENCEWVGIPQECFKSLDIVIEDDRCSKFEAHIIDKNNLIDSGLFDNAISPIHRLGVYYNDITRIEIYLMSGEVINKSIIWRGNYMQDNHYQKSSRISYYEVKVSINKYNKEFSISDIFNLPIGTVIIDNEKNEYEIDENEYGKYLKNTYVTDRILKAKFKIKE